MRIELALSKRVATLDEAHAAAENADRAVAHAERVLSQLLLLARLDEAASDTLTARTTDLAALARRIVADNVNRAAACDVDLGCEAADRAEIRGDEMLLGEILSNLVENAMRYAGRDTATTVRVVRHGGEVVLEVEDNGPGIPPPLRQKVRERFARGNAGSGEGAGLGLSIVAEIARLFGGRFTLAEAPAGSGLVARAIFPAVASPRSPS